MSRKSALQRSEKSGQETSLGICVHAPVYGDVLQHFVGQAVKQDDSLGGNLQSNLLRLLSTRFGLLDTHKNSIITPLTFTEQSLHDACLLHRR